MQKLKKEQKPKVTLRAFSIKNNDLTSSTSHVYDDLLDKLQKSQTTEERCMLLSNEDPNKEKDLISYYEDLSRTKSVFGTMLRIAPGEDAQHVTAELLKKQSFSMTELEILEDDKSEMIPAICRDHYYFSLNNEYLVTNLAGNRTIKNLQTYISWFIKNELLEFTPLIAPPVDTKLSELMNITVSDSTPIFNTPVVEGNKDSEKPSSTVANKSIHLGKQVMAALKNVLLDTETLKDAELSQLISAELLIKFKKPRKMSEEEYEKILGAYLKPISDTENVKFKKKKGGTIINGKDLLKQKTIEIDTTETGKISEPALLQEMSKFLTELKDSEKKAN